MGIGELLMLMIVLMVMCVYNINGADGNYVKVCNGVLTGRFNDSVQMNDFTNTFCNLDKYNFQ